MKDRAAIYARFSSHNQRSESIDIQVDNSTAFCEKKGLNVVRVYADYAKTGTNADRAQFQTMMEDARSGLFDYVVIYKVTRIMRNRDEMALARIMLRKAGVEILYAGEEIASGSSGVLQLGVLEVLAEWESAIDSERIRDGIQKNAQRCMANGRTLYGWDIVDGRYRVNEREAAVLRRMKNMLFSGSTIAEIVRAVSNERSRNNKPFNHDRIRKLLLRVQNGGTYNYAGNVVDGGMPAIWPKHEQDMIISMLSKTRPHRRVDHSREWPLTGKLWCHKCGKTMHGTSGTSKTGATYAYYRCPKCRRTIRRDLLEDAIVDMTLCAIQRPVVRERIAKTMAAYDELADAAPLESELIRKEIRRIDATFERIWRAIEDGIAPPGGKDRIANLTARKSQLEQDYAVAKANEGIEPSEQALMDWLDSAAEIPTEEIIGIFVRAAELDAGEVRLFFAFDHYGDDFTPPKYKGEPTETAGSPNSTMVELDINSTNYSVLIHSQISIQIARSWFAIIGTYEP